MKPKEEKPFFPQDLTLSFFGMWDAYEEKGVMARRKRGEAQYFSCIKKSFHHLDLSQLKPTPKSKSTPNTSHLIR